MGQMDVLVVVDNKLDIHVFPINENSKIYETEEFAIMDNVIFPSSFYQSIQVLSKQNLDELLEQLQDW